MMNQPPRSSQEDGFTIIEMMVAAFVMLVGVLGTLALIDTAMSMGSTSRSREAATNLSREIVEAAREIDYDMLLTSTATSRFQSLSGLADAVPAVAGWQIKRRGTTYTVTVGACVYDDPKDGNFGQNTSAGYCPGLGPGATDPNGDDYRKLTVTAAWDTRQVQLIANVVNPAGGFGPRITNIATTPPIDADGLVKVNAGTTIDGTVTTTAATSLNWEAGDTKHGGQLADASGATSWPFTWDLGTPPATYGCTTAPDWTPDAPAYEMTFQPFDSSGTPGDLRTQIVAIDRRIPYAPCDFTGGRNPAHGGVVDLQWRASFEGDVTSYSVWRERPEEATDRLVCDDLRATVTECTDTIVPPGDGDLRYYIKAQQNNWKFGQGFGDEASHPIAAVVTPNDRPSAPGSVTLTPGTTPEITWTGSTDADGSLIFYRIYRDGNALANRYARTSNANGSSFSFTDKDSGGSAHTYYVSAVDDDFAESSRVQAR